MLNNRSLIRHSGAHFARRRRCHSPAVRTAPRRCIRYKRSQIKISRRVFSSISPLRFLLHVVFLFLPPPPLPTPKLTHDTLCARFTQHEPELQLSLTHTRYLRGHFNFETARRKRLPTRYRSKIFNEVPPARENINRFFHSSMPDTKRFGCLVEHVVEI